MTYDEIKDLTLQLTYRDKFRLAQLLIQVGRKEEDYRTVEIVGNTSNPSGTKQTAQRAVEGAGRNFKTPSIHAGRNLQEGDRVRKSSQTIARRTLQER